MPVPILTPLQQDIHPTHPRQADEFGDLLIQPLKISARDFVPCREGERKDSPCGKGTSRSSVPRQPPFTPHTPPDAALAPGSVSNWPRRQLGRGGVSAPLAQRAQIKDAAGAEREKIHTSAFHATDSSTSSSNTIQRHCWA